MTSNFLVLVSRPAMAGPPAHHGGQAVRSPEFAAETATATTDIVGDETSRPTDVNFGAGVIE